MSYFDVRFRSVFSYKPQEKNKELCLLISKWNLQPLKTALFRIRPHIKLLKRLSAYEAYRKSTNHYIFFFLSKYNFIDISTFKRRGLLFASDFLNYVIAVWGVGLEKKRATNLVAILIYFQLLFLYNGFVHFRRCSKWQKRIEPIKDLEH